MPDVKEALTLLSKRAPIGQNDYYPLDYGDHSATSTLELS